MRYNTAEQIRYLIAFLHMTDFRLNWDYGKYQTS